MTCGYYHYCNDCSVQITLHSLELSDWRFFNYKDGNEPITICTACWENREQEDKNGLWENDLKEDEIDFEEYCDLLTEIHGEDYWNF